MRTVDRLERRMREPKDIKIGKFTLAEILERHKHWIMEDCDGWETMKVDLRGADLRDADLRGAEGNLIEYRKGKILTKDIIGYKKCIGNEIVTLKIPRGSIVFSINGNKCRSNQAEVIGIDGGNRAFSSYKYMSYYAGDKITVYDFNCEYNVECAEGIHFFMTREEAENYNY